MINHIYFLKCVLHPGDVHASELIVFIVCWSSVIGR